MRFRLLILAATLMATPAFAGFEFVSPAGPSAVSPPPARVAAPAPAAPKLTPPPPAASAMPAVPNDRVNIHPLAPTAAKEEPKPKVIGTKAIPLTPVVKRSDALIEEAVLPPPPSASSVSALALPSPIASSSLKAPTPSSVAAAPAWRMPTAALSAPASDDVPVEGFGRQVPLAMALQQIAPPGYRFTFDYGVDSGMRVNWTGGKPWEIIVADIARANNLNVDIVSKVIAFRRRSPLDIVVADGGSRRADVVQGMKLKPVAGGFKPVSTATPVATPVIAKPPEPIRHVEEDDEEEDIEIAALPPAMPAPAIPAPVPAPKAVEAPLPITQPVEMAAAPVIQDDEPVSGGFVYAGTAEPAIVDAPFDLDAVAEWQGLRDMTLRDVLTEWAQLAGVSLVWQSDYDWPLQTDVRIQASFGDSVRTLLAGFGKAQPRPIGRLFRNKAVGVGAQPVLMIETQALTR
jgi:hypothetical protein